MPTLNWLTREQDLKAAAGTPYRLLVEDEKHSYGDSDTGNLIVQGDNLEALKALLPFYAGQVKCIYIDPPYNTGSAFDQYDDNLEHTTWLSMMYPRLELLKLFLREDGSIWITLDDNEFAYSKILCDEIFGRNNFVNTIIWQNNFQSKGYAGQCSVHHNYISVYRKSDLYKIGLLERTEEHNVNYSNPDNDPKGKWRAGDVRNSLYRPNLMYDITSPSGNIIKHPPNGWRFSKTTYEKEYSEGKIVFSRDEKRIIRKIYLCDQIGRVPETIWFGEDVGTTREANSEMKQCEIVFATPKPEALLQRIITLSTTPGDLVLDSFLGSGTTAAVAHKMGRRYIGVEMGEHAKTHCVTRLKKVIDGEQGGISKALDWKGGGGFRFFTLGAEVFDSERRIKTDISFENLAAHIFFTETKTPMKKPKKNSTFLGIHDGTAYALLYNGILGDKSVNGGNVLTPKTLKVIKADIEKSKAKYTQLVIYGEATPFTHDGLESQNIIFKQTPYDIKVW